jgi:glycosyltransferase involved in cell wall biosynthesis
MSTCLFCGLTHHVGFISTRFAGTDGVSLEAAKWADVFEREGFSCFYFGGELDRPPDRSYLVEEAHFTHPDIKDIYNHCFGVHKRDRIITQKIHTVKEKIKDDIYAFIEKFDIDLLVPENSLTIPLNIPLGLAITEVISETEIPTIAHHHDFFWERQQFLTNSVWEYLNMAFPPHLPSIQHVTINSSGDNQLSLRTGISATIIPNVMDFENPPPPLDDYASDVRKALGVEDDELLILQPTRVVKRKGIEHAIELVHRMGKKAKLVISHASGDEGYDYEQRVKEYSRLLNVNTLFVSDIINEQRGRTKKGKKIYTLNDIYPHADLVTYPSTFEGFGNAFLEAVYFKKPIVVNKYSIYTYDIEPKGFLTVEIDGFVSEDAVRMARKVLEDPGFCEKMVDTNYDIAKRCYSYSVLRQKLRTLIYDGVACNPENMRT